MSLVDPHLFELGRAGPGISSRDTNDASCLISDHKPEAFSVALSYRLPIKVVEPSFYGVDVSYRKVVLGHNDIHFGRPLAFGSRQDSFQRQTAGTTNRKRYQASQIEQHDFIADRPESNPGLRYLGKLHREESILGMHGEQCGQKHDRQWAR